MAVQSVAQATAVPGPRLTGLLNAVLRNQFTSTNQVFFNSFILEHWGYHLCAERMYVESVKETRRSMRSLRHLTLMGVDPDLGGTQGLYSPARPLVGRDLGELLQIERRHAEQSLAVVETAVAELPATDQGPIEFLGQARQGQAAYIAWLAAQIEALDTMGEARYREGQGTTLPDGDLKSFLQKVTELQRRDPDFAGGSATVDKVQGESGARILAWINDLLAIEIASIERNFVDAFIFDRHGDGALADCIVMDALAAMRRAQRITEHILALGKAPAPGVPPKSAKPPAAGGVPRRYLDAEKLLEERKASIARAALASANLVPGATRDLFSGLLRQYERRVAWLASPVDAAGSVEGASAPRGMFRAMLQRWGVPA